MQRQIQSSKNGWHFERRNLERVSQKRMHRRRGNNRIQSFVRRGVSQERECQVCQEVPRRGPILYVSRSIPREQEKEWQWWVKVDSKRKRLLQPLQQSP